MGGSAIGSTEEQQPEPIISRGGQPLATRDSYRALLSLSLRLENVGVLLGAGASRGAGGHIMSEVWQELSRREPGLLAWLKEVGLPHESHEFELLLSQVELRATACRQMAMKEAADYEQARIALQRVVVWAALLGRDHWTNPSLAATDPKFANHRSLVQRLIGSRQPGQSAPWIFTTNYDMAVEWSAEALNVHVVDGFSGFQFRKFDPVSFDLGLMNLGARGEARFGSYNLFLAKLHGSLNWCIGDEDVFQKQVINLKSSAFDFADAKESVFEPVIIYPQYAKYVDTIGFVYGELLRRFSEFMSRSSTLLIICGYGFSDVHINRLIASGLRNPTLQVVIYSPLYNGQPSSAGAFIETLLQRASAQVTVIGGGPQAYFDAFIEDMPSPAHFDESSIKAKELMSALSEIAERGGGARA